MRGQFLISQLKINFLDCFKSLKSSPAQGHSCRTIRNPVRNLLSSTTPSEGQEDTHSLDLFGGISGGNMKTKVVSYDHQTTLHLFVGRRALYFRRYLPFAFSKLIVCAVCLFCCLPVLLFACFTVCLCCDSLELNLAYLDRDIFSGYFEVKML